MEFEISKINLDLFAENGWVISDDVFDSVFSTSLLGELKSLRRDGEFFKAGIGKGIEFQRHAEIRSDFIYWIHPENVSSLQKKYLEAIDELSSLLKRTFFIPIHCFEAHFAVFPVGSFYNKHFDQFRESSNRLVTVILYLNENWQKGDGGELEIFLPDGSSFLLEPTFNRFLIFRSDLIEHAVLKTKKERYSITGWLRRETAGIINL